MLRLVKRTTRDATVSGSVTLTLAQRITARQRVTLDDGRQAGIFLQRGLTLRDGDRIASDDDVVIEVKAAPEAVSTAHSSDTMLLARACYHLGNRHVHLQIEKDFVRYQHDHVLDEMARRLGLEVANEHAPFEPEPGAYHTRSQAHDGHHPAHEHSHHHDHSH